MNFVAYLCGYNQQGTLMLPTALNADTSKMQLMGDFLNTYKSLS